MIDQPMRGGSGLSHADVIISCFGASDPAAGHAPLPICGMIRVYDEIDWFDKWQRRSEVRQCRIVAPESWCVSAGDRYYENQRGV